MKKIQILCDVFTVIPSDIDYLESQLEDFIDVAEIVYLFEEGDIEDGIPLIKLSNTGIFNAQITDTDKLIAEVSHLDLVSETVSTILRRYNERG